MPKDTTARLSVAQKEPGPCNLCGSRSFKRLGSSKGFQFLECRDCSLHSTSPFPTGAELLRQYDDFYAGRLVQEELGQYAEKAERCLRHQLSCLQQLHAPMAPPTRFLDVGFGGGHFLRAARRIGLDAFGVEIDRSSFERASQQGIPGIYCGQLKDAPFPPESFDLAKLMHVLEHTPDPLGLLRQTSRFLKPGGWLIVDIPNQASRMARFKTALRSIGLKREDFGYLQPPVHLHAFTPTTLKNLLDQAGFEVVETVFTSPLDERYFPTTSRYYASVRDQFVKLLYRMIGQGSYLSVYARRSDGGSKKAPLSVLLLTFNDEAHVERALRSVAGWAAEIIVVDSFSTDKTLEICRRYTDKIHQHPFENHGKQVNWALDHVLFQHDWIFQLDSDESVMPELAEELRRTLSALPQEVSGLYAKRRVHFMGRWIRHGDYYPIWLLRVFRRGQARNEEFEEDRVILTGGRAGRLRHDFIDDNRKDLTFWTDKHNRWASHEMRDLLALHEDRERQVTPETLRSSLFAAQDQRRRWLKKNVYARSPLFLRAFLHFFYRYVIRLGFLDGREGLIFHFLQGCWYRFLVDAKTYEAGKEK